ncbi:metal-binding protein [Spirulina sp. CS-785/01]|uniref:metal-binding protein n=1 Tax=Spirulina sp. CS-785/01 TaxID=3021716 RepID=UPI0023312EC6|nr:metal-binding protein [Spirulina sp. CS-785/01]MDB9315960.1 metal-binding protein [Spirulina sp. CS-785/01]
MPSGRTHDRITLWSLPWIVLLTLSLTRDGMLTLLVSAAYLFSGLMFGPDLDIYSVQFKRWGGLRWLWIPYQKVLKHRSRLSHGFLIGTVLRVLYLGIILLLVGMVGIAIAQLIGGFAWNWQTSAQQAKLGLSHYRAEAIALFVGLELGAMSHASSDWFGSTAKQVRRKGVGSLFTRKPKKRRKSRRKR